MSTTHKVLVADDEPEVHAVTRLALARLRRQFNDPLFVRTGEGMMPTPRALEFWALIEPILRRPSANLFDFIDNATIQSAGRRNTGTTRFLQ